MSIIKLRKSSQTWLKAILGGFVGIFVIGAFVTFGAYTGPSRAERGEPPPRLVAKIGRVRITREAYEERVRDALSRYGRFGEEVTVANFVRGMVFDQIVDEIVQTQAARREGIGVSRAEVEAKADELVEEQITYERGDMSEKRYRYLLRQQGKTLARRKAEIRRGLRMDQVRKMVLFDKLRQAIEGRVKITEEDLHEKYDEVKARVIFVRSEPGGEEEAQKKAKEEARKKAERARQRIVGGEDFATVAQEISDDYTKNQGGDLGSFTRERYPVRFGEAFKEAVFKLEVGQVSQPLEVEGGYCLVLVEEKKTWPDDFARAEPRSLEEAKKKAEELYQRLKQGEDFAQLARQYSEDSASADKGGDLGFFGRGQMVKPFEEKAFSLKMGEISEPVLTEYGYHIIKVEEKKADQVRARHILIKGTDPQKELDRLREDLRKQKQSQAWNEYLQDLRNQAKEQTVIYDPHLRAIKAEENRETAKAIIYYRQALRCWPEERPEIHYALARLYNDLYNQQRFSPPTRDRAQAAQALAQLHAETAVEALLAALDQPASEVRITAARALGQLKAERAREKLQTLVRTDEDDEVAEAAAAALRALGAEVPPRPADKSTASHRPHGG